MRGLRPSLQALIAVTSVLVLSFVFLAPIRAEVANSSDVSEIRFAADIRPILSENCFACHGPDAKKREGNLRLDEQESAYRVIVPGNARQSLLMERVTSTDPELVMPPSGSGHQLTPEQIRILERWIDSGAPWGRHWSFEPLIAPKVPVSPFAEFPAVNPVDHFVQSELQRRGMTPSVEADRATLIRRVTLDLTGLPPSPEEVARFLNDSSPDAWEKLVDRLLQSEAYGERFAWDWLDAARYADSNGYQGDNDRTMWPWRDWVVRAFNSDLPFDQFTVWQLAGDLLPDPSEEQILATAFCRNYMINGEGGRIAEENRVDYVMDMTETVGTVWLGLTLNCCRCHDHKFDPLTQKNYYQLFDFFNQTPVDGAGGNPQTPPVLEMPMADQTQQLKTLTEEAAAQETRLTQRKEAVIREFTKSEQQLSEEKKQTLVAEDEEAKQLQSDLKKLQDQITELKKAIPQVMVMKDRPERRESFVLTRGLYNLPTAESARADIPESLKTAGSSQEGGDGRLLNRLDLANWLVSNENPVTARVTVNRFWQQIFGTGLVKTSEDFGSQGEFPQHHDLLDWLALDFREHGWSVKRLIRTIVLSHTYRQSSVVKETDAVDPDGRRLTTWDIDPENRFLARGARYRLPSWMLRDQVLSVSGLLNRQNGGPPVRPYQPDGVWEEATFGKKTYSLDSGDAVYRRSLYVFWRRIIAPTMFFDSASRQTCSVRSSRTNSPMHALLALNDTAWTEAARVLSQKVLASTMGGTDQERLRAVFQAILCRDPDNSESSLLLEGLERTRTTFREAREDAESLLSVGASPRDPKADAVELASWTVLTLSVMNLDEALTRE